MQEVRQRLARKAASDRLRPLGITPWILPRGGFYLWCRLPNGHDSTLLAQRCMDANIILAPGNVFSISQSAASFLGFNVTQMDDPRVFSVLEQRDD